MSSENYKIVKKIYPDGSYDNPDLEFKHAGWGSRFAQNLRYRSINTILRNYIEKYHSRFSTNPKILELGCGFGVFYNMVSGVDYFGVDLNTQSIQYCKKKYGEVLFDEMDITSVKFWEFLKIYQPDYIIASGVFDHAYIWHKIIKDAYFEELLKNTKYGLIGTMLFDATPDRYRDEKLKDLVVFTSPFDIFGLLRNYIYSQELFFDFKYDYLDNDYTFALLNKAQLELDHEYLSWKS
jgi:hypothetical protein